LPRANEMSTDPTNLRERIRLTQADLARQGVALFPCTSVGQRAHTLWKKIRPHLLRGGAIQMTPSSLKLGWHRQELKRAREILVEMRLIRPRADGLYVLGTYDPVDELAREASLDLRLIEGVLVGLSGFLQKSKTQ
jgi:hypothetical protein